MPRGLTQPWREYWFKIRQNIFQHIGMGRVTVSKQINILRGFDFETAKMLHHTMQCF